MTVHVWLAFAATAAILVLIPGPTVLLVVSYALGQGWRAALPTAIGVALGDFTAMTLSMLGVGALLAASAQVFTVLKWIGAAYLVWLGIKLWRAGGSLDAQPRTDRASKLKMFGARVARDIAQSEEHHVLRGFPAAIPRSPRGLLQATRGAGGDVPRSVLFQRVRICRHRNEGAWNDPQSTRHRGIQQGRRQPSDRRRHCRRQRANGPALDLPLERSQLARAGFLMMNVRSS